LRLALSKGPNRVGVPLFPLLLTEDGSRTSFRNVVILIAGILFYSSDDGKSPKTHYFTTLYTVVKTF
jgi:hypothetical protein